MVTHNHPKLRNWHTYIYRDREGHYHNISVVNIHYFAEISFEKHWHIVATLEGLTREEKDGLYFCYTNEQRQNVLTGIVRCLNKGISFDPQCALNDLHRVVCDYLSKRNS